MLFCEKPASCSVLCGKTWVSVRLPLRFPRKQQVVEQRACLLFLVQEDYFKLHGNNDVTHLLKITFCLLFPPENYLGHSAKNAVITVPAYFNDSQRQVFPKL